MNNEPKMLVDMSVILAEVCFKLKEEANKKGLSFEVFVDQGNYQIKASPKYLTQAIQNLIDNSIHTTDRGGLKISLRRDDVNLIFSIQDTGIGLSKENSERLFADNNSRAGLLRPTGFGLFVAKSVIGMHRGEIWAESDGEGRGATYHVTLPILE